MATAKRAVKIKKYKKRLAQGPKPAKKMESKASTKGKAKAVRSKKYSVRKKS